MTVKLEFKVSRKLRTAIVAKYSQYDIRAGVIDDASKPHKVALPKSHGLATLEGGPARKRSGKTRGTIGQVAAYTLKGNDWLRAPILADQSKDMRAFKVALLTFFAGKSASRSQTETALRAVLRNPILRGKYGRNSRLWASIKGFNRKLIDTGQVYRSIVARVRKVKTNVQA